MYETITISGISKITMIHLNQYNKIYWRCDVLLKSVFGVSNIAIMNEACCTLCAAINQNIHASER